jgi:hypothetical protein
MDLSHEVLAALKVGSNLVTQYDKGLLKPMDTAKPLAHFDWLAHQIEIAQKFDFTSIHQKFDFTSIQKTFSKELHITAAEVLWHGQLAIPFNPSFFNFYKPDEPGVAVCVLVAPSDSPAWATAKGHAMPKGVPGIVTEHLFEPEVEEWTSVFGQSLTRRQPSVVMSSIMRRRRGLIWVIWKSPVKVMRAALSIWRSA